MIKILKKVKINSQNSDEVTEHRLQDFGAAFNFWEREGEGKGERERISDIYAK